jgi:hypothetical protein
VNLEVK